MASLAGREIFFVCGAPKSGTTWLQRVLDAHPQIQCSGEGHFIERFSVPLAQVMREYIDHMKTVASVVYEDAPYYPQCAQEDMDRLVRTFVTDRLLCRKPGPEIRWIGDKTPRYTSGLKALLRLFPRARFINITRDPRDMILSRIHHARREGVVNEAFESGSEHHIGFIRAVGTDWTRSMQPVETFAAEHPGIIHMLKYEDMLADPAGEAGKLFRFLGARHDQALVGRVVAATSFEAMSGRKPGEEHPTAFLRKGIAGDWVGKFKPDALAALDETCGDLMRAHGYF